MNRVLETASTMMPAEKAQPFDYVEYQNKFPNQIGLTISLVENIFESRKKRVSLIFAATN